MTYFAKDYIALLEFLEGEDRKGRKLQGQWHYNYGTNMPETFGWRGVLWYDHENKDACRMISGFCDVMDKAFPQRNQSYETVLDCANVFFDALSDEMQKHIKPYRYDSPTH